MRRAGYSVRNMNAEYPNHPVWDLLVARPGIKPFFVQVKGLAAQTAWPVGRPRPDIPGLFYILTVLAPQRFFILSQRENNATIGARSGHLERRRS
jgi:hypothetical protein